MEILISFILAVSILAISPGPDNIFVLMQSVVHGKKYGLATIIGLMTGCIVHTTFVAVGISTIIKENNINILHIRSRAPAWLLPFIDKKNLTTVSTFHNVYGHQNTIKKLYNKGLAKTDYIVAISKYVKEEIVEVD